MSFTITKNIGKDEVWHVQDKKPEVYINNIMSLYADGDELIKIRARFENIPISRDYCCWRGEMAQFIFDNL